jgi:hypothetical protein
MPDHGNQGAHTANRLAGTPSVAVAYFVDPDEMSCEVLDVSHADLVLATANHQPFPTSTHPPSE